MKYLKTRINKIIIAVLFCILPAGGLTACKGPAAPPAETNTQIPSESAAAEAAGTQENFSPEYPALTPERENSPTSDVSSENLPYDSETIIEEQSFSGMDLGDYRNVRFTTSLVTRDGQSHIRYSLVSGEETAYTFPDAYSSWHFEDTINFITFHDINGDGKKDVITSEQYTTGAGSEDARIFSMVRIYLNQGKEFLFAEGLSISIGNSLEVSDGDAYTAENVLSVLSEPAYCNFDGTDGWTKGEIESFAFLVKEDVLTDDREALSRKVRYPLHIVRDGSERQINSPEEFLENYDLILNLQVIYDVEGSETEGLFWNQSGVMLGTGAVWFGKTEDGTVKITAIPAEVQYCNPLNVD